MEIHGGSGRRVSLDPLVLCLLALSLAGNVYLALQVMRRPVQVASSEARPRIGDSVSAFAAETTDGAPAVIDAGEGNTNTVYYMFTPSCPWCARNLENVRTIAAGAGKTYRFVAVSLDPNVAAYVQRNQIGFPVFINPSRETSAAFGLGAVPQTVVVSPEGKVVRHWKGAYGPVVLKEVSTFLGISLPGLLEAGNPANQSN